MLLDLSCLQLEASIRNGDLQGFELFSEALKNVSSTSRKKDQLNVQQGASEKVLQLPPFLFVINVFKSSPYTCLT